MQKQSQNQVQNEQNPNIILILPSKKIPQVLKPYIEDLKDIQYRFITGHRNIIQKNKVNEYEWALVQNANYCGQVCCFLLKQTLNKQEIQNFPKIVVENSCSVLEKYSEQTFIFRCLTPSEIKEEIPNLTINQLIDEVLQCKETTGVAINLIKNSFDHYQDYKILASAGVQKRQEQWLDSISDPVPTVTEMISMECNTTKLVGQNITKVPKCNSKTGIWNSTEVIDIKFIE